jgi:hypothetical protein
VSLGDLEELPEAVAEDERSGGSVEGLVGFARKRGIAHGSGDLP